MVTIILELDPNNILTNFTNNIEVISGSYTQIATKSNLATIAKKDQMNTGTLPIAFGDSEKFQTEISLLTSIIFSTADVIMFAESYGDITTGTAEFLYEQNCFQKKESYEIYKVTHSYKLSLKLKKLFMLCQINDANIRYLLNNVF